MSESFDEVVETRKHILKRAKDYLVTRAQAYRNVFNPGSVYTEKVLADLAKFCRANESTFHEDDRLHATLEGRREVWLRIQHHLKLDPHQLWNLYGRKDLE